MKKIITLALTLCVLQFVLAKSPKPLFMFAQLTDPQMGMISENKNCEEEIRLYTETVRYINQLKPSFVVVTGDLVNNRMDSNQINTFIRITSSIHKSIPVYLIPGNHDVDMKPTKVSLDSFLQKYSSDRFEFTYKNVQFIGINSCLIQAGIKEDTTQFNWLKACLEKGPKSMRKVVFTHQPFFIRNLEEKNTYDNIAEPSRSEYLDLFKKNGVVAVFSGHFHKNAEANYQGIDLVISSSVGKPLGNVGSGLRIVNVYPDSIAHQFIELSKITEP